MGKFFFAPRGKKFSDFDLIKYNNKIYVIFIEREKKDKKILGGIGNSYGLASSEDGFFWTYHGTIRKPVKDNEWKNGGLWALDIFRHQDKFCMFYSSVQDIKGDPHDTQQIGLAYSPDLINWKDSEKNPVISYDNTKPFYYPKNVHKFCWRDPNIYPYEDKYYCVMVAKDIEKSYEKSGCVALLKSDDLISWKNLPPLFSPGKYWELEAPFIFQNKDKYFLLYGEYSNGICMRYATSDKLLGEYEEPKLNIITPSYCYAAKVIKFKHDLYFYHWITDNNRVGPEKYLAPPKLVEVQKDKLFLKKHPVLEEYFEKIPLKSFLDSIQEKKRIKVEKKVNDLNLKIKIRTENPIYSRNIFFNQFDHGVSIRDFGLFNNPNDLRTLELNPDQEYKFEMYIEDNIIEIYINGYFVYSTFLEKNSSNIKKFEIIEG